MPASTMDSSPSSNGLGKLFSKSITSKRRRSKASSTAASDAASSNDDVQAAAQKLKGRGSTPASDARSLNGSLDSSPSIPSNLSNAVDDHGDSDPEFSNRSSRPTAISAHPSQIGYLTTSSPLVVAAYNPEPLSAADTILTQQSTQSTRSSTLPAESSDSLESAPSLERGRTTLEAPELRQKRSTSASRLRDVFKSKKSLADEKGPAAGSKPEVAATPKPAEPEPKVSVDRSRRLSRGQKLEPLKAPPRTPPGEPATPVIVNTPPTPTDPHPGGGSPRRPADALLAGSMSTTRRRAGSNAGPSKLSTITAPPLTPTPENGPTTPGNPATTFFSSMFSAVQNTANSLTTTIPGLAQGAGKGKGGTPSKEQAQGEREIDTVEVESVASQRPSTEPKEPAVKTLGMGDLSLSHLGIVDAPSAAPSPVAARFAETETRARSESAPAEPHAVGLDLADESRPRSFHEASGGERTPPAGSVYEGKSGIQRTGSIRSALGHRRNRGSSIATHATTATSTIGAAIAAANSSLVNPGATGNAPKLTGFAVANKKRNRDFHTLFKSVPDDDYLIEDYSCALQREILAHGRLYISEGHLCFSSNILGWITTLVMSFDEIVAVEKRSTALVFKNGLEISTLHAKHVFASFASRDTTYDLIIKIWKLGHPHLQSSLNGVRLEEPGGDRTEKVDVESVSVGGSHSISGSDDESDEGDDVYDEDEDEGDGAAGPPADGPITESAEKAAPRKVSGAVAPPEKVEDGAPAGAADFPGPATHAPTDCGDAATHFEKVLGDDVIPAPLGKIYTMLFGPASAAWMGKWLTGEQKCTELQMEDKRGLTEEVKTRNFTYIKPLSGSIGPKQTKCIVTEQLEHLDLDKAVNVLVSTQNPDVPNGNIFVVKTKYCLTWAENNGTRIQINNVIEWSGKSWLKGAIERGANEGQAQYCKDLFAALKSAVSSRPRAASALNGAGAGARGPGGKKRGRKTKSGALAGSNAASDAEGAALGKKAAGGAGRVSWGLLEPVRPVLGPVVDVLSPIVTGNVVYGLLVGLLVASWFGFGSRHNYPSNSGNNAALRYDPAAVLAGSAPLRMAAYEELWRHEESELWEWIEARAGLAARLGGDGTPLEAAGKGGGSKQRGSLLPRTVREKVREEKMDERELREAIRVTEEKLEVLKAVVDRRGEKVGEKGKKAEAGATAAEGGRWH